MRDDGARRARWVLYLAAAGAGGAALIGPYLVLVLLACGTRRAPAQQRPPAAAEAALTAARGAESTSCRRRGRMNAGGRRSKVGALSYGGGFVIIPLMQGDAVHTYHWMTNAEFLNAVALGQVTPGPVVATIAAVGYAAHGLKGGILAAAVAFTPSFSFILLGGQRFRRLRGNAHARAFLDRQARPRSARSWAPPSRSRWRCTRPGRRACSPSRRGRAAPAATRRRPDPAVRRCGRRRDRARRRAAALIYGAACR